MSTDYEDWCCCGIRSSKIDFSHTHRQYILHWEASTKQSIQYTYYQTHCQEYSQEIKKGPVRAEICQGTHAEFHKGKGAGDLSPSPGYLSKRCLDTWTLHM